MSGVQLAIQLARDNALSARERQSLLEALGHKGLEPRAERAERGGDDGVRMRAIEAAVRVLATELNGVLAGPVVRAVDAALAEVAADLNDALALNRAFEDDLSELHDLADRIGAPGDRETHDPINRFRDALKQERS